MKTFLVAVAVVAGSIATPSVAGGLGNVMINAGEIRQGVEQDRQQRSGQQPQQDKVVNVTCGPMAGTHDMPERNCTRQFESGRIEVVQCKMDGAGMPYCYPL